jgi:dipeptidyl aminopeptidase/acylaminoacyl peptidase
MSSSWNWPARRLLALVVGMSLALALAGPAALAAKMSPEDVAGLRTVVDARISPDGGRIAYTLSIPRDPIEDENGPAWTELRVVRFDGSGDRTFVGGEVNVSQVRWSPDGTLITYVSKRHGDEHSTVWAIPADGGESFRLVEHGSSVASYDWRPDSRAIAFVAAEPEPDSREKEREKGFNQEIYEEDWLPRRVYVSEIPLDASDETPETRAIESLPGQAWHVAWSPDAESLAVDLSPTPLVDDNYMFRRIHVIDAESGDVRARIDNPGKLGRFGWSADGSSLLMISAADINDPMEGRLMTAPAGGGAPTDLMPTLVAEGHVESFDVAADGTVFFVESTGVATRIGKIGPGDGQRRILYQADGTSGALPYGLDISADGRRAALVADSPLFPGEVFSHALGPDAPARITDSNEWLSRIDLARQEIVEYEARDGLMIQGLLIHPLERSGEARVPLIVVAHGGPEAHFRNGWLTRYSYPGQVAAGRGYAVFYPNYRGSTGRGVPFSKADQGDGGGQEFLDVIDGVEYLFERGLIDRDRVGITGGSYGGFFTALGATRYSEHFAAGVMFVGISNQLSKAGTTDIPREMELVHWLTNVRENLDLFLDRSPVLHVDKARTPLLIMHGKEDPRVDPGQSRELYRALKLKGDVPVRLVLYPGEGHGNRKAAARLDYSLRMLRWLDHFLLEGGDEAPDWEVDYGLEEVEEEED